MKFYRWLVVNFNPEAGALQVIPAKSEREANDIAGDVAARGGQFFVADARIDDDGNLFWSGTDTGWPITDFVKA